MNESTVYVPVTPKRKKCKVCGTEYEGYTCPNCGYPSRFLFQDTEIQVQCTYCGAIIKRAYKSSEEVPIWFRCPSCHRMFSPWLDKFKQKNVCPHCGTVYLGERNICPACKRIVKRKEAAGRLVQCPKCKYTWTYKGNMLYVTCPNCHRKSPIV